MLTTISPYAGFAAAGTLLLILVIDHLLRAGRARAVPARVPAPTAPGPVHRRVTCPDADITQRLPVIRPVPAAIHGAPPLPPASFRRQPAPPVRPASRLRAPDEVAAPRSTARLMTPWGELARLPGSVEPGIVPSLLPPGPVAAIDGEERVLLGVGQVGVGPHGVLDRG